ncbi:MAG: TIGR03086 family metal-binding protein [Acidimicrobiales bacterium]
MTHESTDATTTTERIDALESMLAKTLELMTSISPDAEQRPTPCADFSVADLLQHLAVWVRVFDGAVNDRELLFDPFVEQGASGTTIEDHAAVFAAAAESIVAGLRGRGVDSPMTMTADPLPGAMVMAMLLMEYVGHGWDLATATGSDIPFSDREASIALDAARSIIQPEYRGTGMFDDEVVVGEDAPAIDRFVGFLGRTPAWAALPTAAC